MKSVSIVAASIAALFTLSAYAEVNEAQMAEFESECKKYAVEEEVPADEMKDYVAQCVQDMVLANVTGESEPAEGEGRD